MKNYDIKQPRYTGNPANRDPYVSRRQAAMILGVMPATMDKVAAANGLTVRQIPGHVRRHFVRTEVEALAAAAVSTGARA